MPRTCSLALAIALALAMLTACAGLATEAPGSGAADPPPVAAPPSEEGASAAPTVGPLCGTRGAAACATGSFCDFAAGAHCGADDRGGHCAPIPTACTREYLPVCGCDGQTYATACVAHSAAVAVAHDGPC